MLTWNRIPLPVERPQVEKLEQPTLELCVADYTASLLSRWGDIEVVPASEVTPDPLYVLELQRVELASGGSFCIGQLPMIEDEIITEPQSFSLVVPGSASQESLQVAIRGARVGTNQLLVDHEGLRLDYDDVLELTAALKAVWTSFNDGILENEVPHDLRIFPHTEGESWLDYESAHFRRRSPSSDFCQTHKDQKQLVYRPAKLFLPSNPEI